MSALQRMSAAEYRRLSGKPSGNRRVKNATPMMVDGLKFDSRREARVYGLLRYRLQRREIEDLRRQVKIPLKGALGPILTPKGRQAVYIADFTFDEVETGEFVVVDAKGHPTEVYLLKRAILAAQGITVTEL